jgi:hypothetical protein
MIFALALAARTLTASDVRGKLELIDGGPDTTPVDQLPVPVRSLDSRIRVSGQPDAEGDFVLQDVSPGGYFLDLTFPGRIRTFARGPRELNPLDFELKPGETALLRIAVSVKTSGLIVDVQGLPGSIAKGAYVAVLWPSDPYLTLNHSCFSTQLSSAGVEFPYTVPGKYLVFVVDSRFQQDIAFNAGLREVLREKAAAVEVLENGRTGVSAFYMDSETVQQAIRSVETQPAAPPARP